MPLSTTDIAALSRLLDEALELDASQREAWLSKLPAAEQHLAPKLREMLAARDSTGTSGFLAALPALDDTGSPDEATARAGESVGPYRLIREIGRGGMGTVWLAERADGAFKRHLALKLPRLAWGAGLAKRMARERDIGAMLEHPNIARLYDAGVVGDPSSRSNTSTASPSTPGADRTSCQCATSYSSSCRWPRPWPTPTAGWWCTAT